MTVTTSVGPGTSRNLFRWFRQSASGGLAALAAFALLLGQSEARTTHHHLRHHRHHVRQIAARHHSHHHIRHHRRRAAFHGPVHEAILIDAETGRVLSQSNADALTYPASLTKMMTLYLTFQALNQGKLSLDERLPISALAASEPPTKLGLRPGDSVSVHNLILGIVTRSANDAAVVLAEGIAGSQAAFARRMTAKARQLGMARTFYDNASGLPAPRQHTTARDVARLALALYRDFPHDWHYFSTPEFDFRGQTITTHNHLLQWYRGADGIKTGYIHASGFNLAASAVRQGHRLIGVIMGGRTAHSRDQAMAALLNHGFTQLAEMSGRTRMASAASAERAAQLRSASVARTAARLAAHLSPIGRAEAAARPSSRHEHGPHRDRGATAERGWSVQLGAFNAKAAAQKLARAAVRLPIAKGRRVEIVKLDNLYRARLVTFTKKGARRTCARLEKKDFSCLVVRNMRVAAAKPVKHWSVQLGAFRVKKKAKQLARVAARLPIADGRPVRVVRPEDGGLFRTRVANFTRQGAHSACVKLKKKDMPCAVVPTIRVASR